MIDVISLKHHTYIAQEDWQQITIDCELCVEEAEESDVGLGRIVELLLVREGGEHVLGRLRLDSCNGQQDDHDQGACQLPEHLHRVVAIQQVNAQLTALMSCLG